MREIREVRATEQMEEVIEDVDIRELWPNEARDFTPWLAQNLGLLGEKLGMHLELVSQEEPVGPYYLDILAKDVNSDALVAIENQLEWTDRHTSRTVAHLRGGVRCVRGCVGRIRVQ